VVGGQVARQAPEVVEDARAVQTRVDGALPAVLVLTVVGQRLARLKRRLKHTHTHKL
jgi:hypothetical protein